MELEHHADGVTDNAAGIISSGYGCRVLAIARWVTANTTGAGWVRAASVSDSPPGGRRNNGWLPTTDVGRPGHTNGNTASANCFVASWSCDHHRPKPGMVPSLQVQWSATPARVALMGRMRLSTLWGRPAGSWVGPTGGQVTVAMRRRGTMLTGRSAAWLMTRRFWWPFEGSFWGAAVLPVDNQKDPRSGTRSTIFLILSCCVHV